jgi:hypothetical protein
MITEDEGIKPKRPKVKTKAWVSGKRIEKAKEMNTTSNLNAEEVVEKNVDALL